ITENTEVLRGSGMTRVQTVPVKQTMVRSMVNSFRGFWCGYNKAPYYLAAGGLLMSVIASSAQASYLEHPEAQSLISELVAEEGFQQKELEQWLGKAEKKQNI